MAKKEVARKVAKAAGSSNKQPQTQQQQQHRLQQQLGWLANSVTLSFYVRLRFGLIFGFWFLVFGFVFLICI